MSSAPARGHHHRGEREEIRAGAAPIDRSRTPPGAPEGLGEPRTLVIALSGRIPREAVPAVCGGLRRLLEQSDAEVIVCDVGGVINPDLVTLDLLTRIQLTARRLGRAVRLDRVRTDLEALLSVAGLTEVVRIGGRSPLEPRGQPEQGEPPLRIEEERDPGDPVA